MKKILILCLILAQAQLGFADENGEKITLGDFLGNSLRDTCTASLEINTKNLFISSTFLPTCVAIGSLMVISSISGGGRGGGCISCRGGSSMAVTVATEIATAGPQGAVSSEILRDQSFQDAAFYLKQDGFAGETVYDYAMEILRLAEQ